MVRESYKHAEQLLARAIESGMVPGAAAAFGIRERIIWQHAAGMALVQGGIPRPMTLDTWFDVASLTKVMATLPSILVLAGTGSITLTDPVSRYLPLLRDGRWAEVTLRHLLTHSAGLAPDRPYFLTRKGPEDFLEAIRDEPWDHEPGAHVAYSDLGFILLGAVVQAISGQTLADFAHEHVFKPLGITQARFRPGEEIRSRTAATELIDGQALVGVVHDENARSMGGIAGHAGLFATLAAVSRYAVSWAADGPDLFSPSVRAACTRLVTAGLNGSRGLGWVLPGDGYDVSGDFWPQSGAGHTGFTGTSLQFDPVSGAWAVLLTNRVHYGRSANINALRRAFHNIVMASLASNVRD